MQSPMLKSYISNCQNSPSVNLKQQKKDPINNIPKTGNDKNDTYIGSHVLKKTKKQKLIDLSCSVGLVALIGFYILKNDTSRARKLAKHIDFIPADTIEEAIKFVQKHLKIQEYNGFEKNDIDVINWINEGIVQVSNAHKGKIRVPKKINYTQLSSNTIAGVVTDKYDPLYGSFYVNKNYFEDIDIEVQMHRDYLRLIKNKIAFYKTIGISIDERDIKRIEEKIDSKSSGFKDKVEFIKTVSACSEITDILEERPYIAISQLLQEGKITSQDLGNQTIEDISKMDLKAQCQLLKKVVNIINSKTGSKCEFKPLKASPFKTIFHER